MSLPPRPSSLSPARLPVSVSERFVPRRSFAQAPARSEGRWARRSTAGRGGIGCQSGESSNPAMFVRLTGSEPSAAIV